MPRICSSNDWRNTKMSEETFGLAVLIFGAASICGIGLLVACLPLLDRLIARWKRKHA